MAARLVLGRRLAVSENSFVEMVVWELPRPVRGSTHEFKYRLAFIVDDVCVIRFDNETGKGDHKHLGGREVLYSFTTLSQLEIDFWDEIRRWRAP
jgi:hypothetical protein